MAPSGPSDEPPLLDPYDSPICSAARDEDEDARARSLSYGSDMPAAIGREREREKRRKGSTAFARERTVKRV